MDSDVLVIGGGLTGLALADRLKTAGISVNVIEARQRLGGRIHSPAIAGARFDLGPAWFWGGQPKVAALAQQFGLATFTQFNAGDMLLQNPSGVVSRRQSGEPAGYRLDGGLAGLIEGLASRLPRECRHIGVRANVVTRVNGAWRVDVRARAFTARSVVIALPPRLAAASIQFDPPLEKSVSTALSGVQTWMAGHAKFVAVYDAPFWRDAGLSGDAFSQRGPMVQIHDASPNDGHVGGLFGFIGVPAPHRADAGEAAIKSACLEQFTDLFGEKAATPIDVVLKDWSIDSETATAVDADAPWGHPAYGPLTATKPLERERLYFASTETARSHGGLIEGALNAAEETFLALTKASA